MPNLNIDSLLSALSDPRSVGALRSARSLEEGLAYELMAAHDDEERCPSRAKRRAEAIFQRQPMGFIDAVARLVFDSWGTLAPAARSAGLARLFRYEHELGSIDIEVTPSEAHDALEGDTNQHHPVRAAQECATPEHAAPEQAMRCVTLIVALEHAEDTSRVRVLHGDQSIDVALDDEGTGSLHLSVTRDATEPVVVVILDELGEAWRTPPLEILSG